MCGIKSLRMFAGVFLLLSATQGSWAAAEQLDYLAYYKGPLTLGRELPIADVKLETIPVETNGHAATAVTETRMTVSSKAYDFVEEKYPFRVLYRSLHQSEPVRSLALERYRQGKKIKHELIWMDQSGSQVMRLKKKSTLKVKSEQALPEMILDWMPPMLGFRLHSKLRYADDAVLLDRLSMLQAMRDENFHVGQEIIYPVTDGKRLYEYRIKVEKDTYFKLSDGRKHAAWKLRIDGYSANAKQRKQKHRPIYLWLEKNSGVPLLFETNHILGLFRIELKSYSA